MDMLDPINPIKILVHTERILSIINNEDVAQIVVGIDISNICNNDCIWCLYKHYRAKHNTLMSKKSIFKIIPELKKAGVLALCFSGGGEPTVNKQCSNALIYARNQGLEVSLNTNGMLLDKITDEALRSLKYLRVSLDSGSNETHNILHQPKKLNSFNYIINSLKRICKKNLTTVGIGFLVHKLNCNEIYSLAKLLDEIRCDYIQIRPLKNISLSKDDLEAVHEQIKLIKQNLKIHVYESFSKMTDTINKNTTFSKCYIKHLVSSIGPDGYVYPCCELRGIKPIGNINSLQFSEIWNSHKHKSIMQTINIKDCPPCKYAKSNEMIENFIVNDNIHKNFI